MLTQQGNRKRKIIILAVFTCLLIVSCLRPIYPAEMFLQHSVTLIVIVILLTVTLKNSLSDTSFTVIVLFMLLHLVGARWIYSYVPYEEWFRAIAGNTPTDITIAGRNHYDRFVHLMFGIMMYFPFSEIYIRWFGLPAKFAPLLALFTVAAFSLSYEVFEWGLTLVLSPQEAENYNGQQGDMWDAQKDMALAFGGALVSIIVSSFLKKADQQE